MKAFCLLLFACSSLFYAQKQSALDSLVFDFSSDLRSTLPADGWVKMSFSVVHYETKLNLAFKATCLESGKELPFYPQKNRFYLNAGEELPITLFMNEECGKLENLPVGAHNRVIRFQFVDVLRKDTLTFDQTYVIQVPE